MRFKYRSNEPELMDHEGSDDELRRALMELKLINKYLGGNSASVKAVDEIKKKFNKTGLRILDAGSGASDMLHGLPGVKLTALDKNEIICRVIKEKENIDVVCGDVLKIPLRIKSFDIVHCSLFLHHFDDNCVVPLLKEFCSLSRNAVIINDLQRSGISYYGFRILSGLFSGNRLVKHDGPVSVKRGFKRSELINFLNGTGFKYKINWKWAFRWIIIIYSHESL